MMIAIFLFCLAAALMATAFWAAFDAHPATLYLLFASIGCALLGLGIAADHSETKRTDEIADRLGLEVVTVKEDYFMATDSDGKTVRCSITQDEKSIVCNGKAYKL